MCRKLVIELKWGDDAPEDAEPMLMRQHDYNELDPEFQQQLYQLIEDYFFGAISHRIEDL